MTDKKQEKKEEKKEKKQKKKDKVAELTELLQKVQADFENYRKQVEKRVGEMRETAAQDLILQLLPIVDNFELALRNTEHKKHQDFIQGLKLIQAQIASLLKDQGVKEIETEGKLFDPYFHEALMKVGSELPENTILEEFQKGFTLHGQVLRHAKVKVSSGKKKEKDSLKQVQKDADTVFIEDKEKNKC